MHTMPYASPCIVNQGGVTALHIACAHGQCHAAKELLECGANPQAVTCNVPDRKYSLGARPRYTTDEQNNPLPPGEERKVCSCSSFIFPSDEEIPRSCNLQKLLIIMLQGEQPEVEDLGIAAGETPLHWIVKGKTADQQVRHKKCRARSLVRGQVPLWKLLCRLSASTTTVLKKNGCAADAQRARDVCASVDRGNSGLQKAKALLRYAELRRR